ncbi:MAG: adenylyltransferase/cytidyltransferase family protein [Patescibacteria group bacterium]
MKALFIGRFQPFHLGHLSVLADIDKTPEIAKILIGIGSSQYHGTEDNPLTFEKRKEMIEIAIKNEIKKPCQIYAVPDIHDDQFWVSHVKEIVGDFDLVYSGNSRVTKLFKQAECEVKPVEFKYDISGTKLRKMIKENHPEWKKFIPKSITNTIAQ